MRSSLFEGNSRLAVLLTLCFVIVIWTTLAFAFAKNKYSWFWRPNIQHLKQTHDRRVKAARDYFSNLLPSLDEPADDPWTGIRSLEKTVSHESMCVVVTAAPRKNDDVIMQSLHGLASRQGVKGRPVPINVVFNPGKNVPFLDELLENKIDPKILNIQEIKDNNQLKSIISVLSDPEDGEGEKFFTEHRSTYVSALDFCEGYEYILVLEDDVFPAKNYMETITKEVIPLIKKLRSDDFAFVKLYFGKIDWDLYGDPADIALFSFMSLTSAAIATFLMSYTYSKSSKVVAFIIFVIWTVNFALIFLALGRSRVVPQGRGLRPTDQRCCCLAHIYTKESAKDLRDYLLAAGNYRLPLDLHLDRWAVANKLQRYIYRPHLFQHIGVYSTHDHGNQGDYTKLEIAFDFMEDIFDGELFARRR